MGGICGAIAGAYIVLGVKYGEDNKVVKEKMKIFNDKFIENNKYYNCSELLGGNPTNTKENEIITQKGLKNTICPKSIASSINILNEIL